MSIRVLLSLIVVGLLSIVGCSESDQPTAMDTRAEEQAVEQAQGGEVSQVAPTRNSVEAEAAQPEQAASDPDQQRTDLTESESEPTPALADRQQSVQSEPEQQSEPTEVQEEAEAPPTNLTDVPATVIKDADLRVRPGLPWPVIERLSAGDEVVILNVAIGWYRISYGDEREGWIRRTALDLGVVEPHRILHQPAPAIVAEWQGEQYGVMGQSADGAEVRLLPMDDELAKIVSAPIDEVTLLASDISVQDLPILIGDETVVFPGDDFSVGQGRILPKAHGWRWLSSGELLGYNDEHIWYWRPLVDELELARRPSGGARLSWDGRYLAIANCLASERECSWFLDAVLLPLDGSTAFSIREAFRRLKPERELPALFFLRNTAMQWSADSTALLVNLAPTDVWGQWLDPLLIRTDGRAVLLPVFPANALEGKDCLQPRPNFGNWRFRMDNTIVYAVTCRDENGEYGEFEYLDVLFGIDGEFLRLEPNTTKYVSEADSDKEAEFIRSAMDAETLGEDIEILWSSSRQHAVVASNDSYTVWLYDAAEHRIRTVSVAEVGLSPLEAGHPTAWVSWAAHWHGDSAVAVHRIVGLGPDRDTVLVDVSSATVVAIDLGDRYWPQCLPSGGWSPNGELVQAILSGDGTDGLFTVDRSYSQIIVHRSNGSHAYALRTTPRHIPRKYPSFWLPNAKWSPDGAWFVVGSIQQAGTCHFLGP